MKKKWFKAKKIGYGWYPATWQGWAVLLGYVLFTTYVIFSIENSTEKGLQQTALLVVNVVITTGILIAICYETGEKAQWRRPEGLFWKRALPGGRWGRRKK